MLIGSYRHQVDGKGRVAVPSSLRRDLQRGSVVSIGAEGRLVIRPPEEWAAVVERHRLTADTSAEERNYMRRLFGSARELELDGQGRMLLDGEHRRWAGIVDRAVFVGLGNCVEVIGEQVWDAEMGEMDQATFTELGDRVSTRSGLRPAATSPSA